MAVQFNTLRIDLHIHTHNESDHKLDRVLAALAALTKGQLIEMAEIDDLVAKVAAEKTVEDSAVALLTTLTDKVNTLVQNATDLATLKGQIAAVTGDVASHTDELSAAVVANTPAAP